MRQQTMWALMAALGAQGCASGTSYVHSDVPLGRVVVYQNGIAYFERTADLDQDQLSLRVPEDKVDDFLKSLTVVDRATGQPAATARPTLMPATEGGVVEMAIALAGPRPHRVRLAYVTDAPAWKPTYRIVLGKGGTVGLQGWAIVDNVSGEDWTDVNLGVASSSALSFKFDLRALRVVQRERLGAGDAFALAPPQGEAAYAALPVDMGTVVTELSDDALATADPEPRASERRGADKGGQGNSAGLEQLRRRLTTMVNDARKMKDVVRTLCTNDKLSQVEVALRSARDRERERDQAKAKGDVELVRHQQSVLDVLAERGHQLEAEADQCVGEELAFAGSGKVNMEIERVPGAGPKDEPKHEPGAAREQEYRSKLADLESRVRELKERVGRSHTRFRIEGLALEGESDPAAAGLARAERAREQLLRRGIPADRIEAVSAGVRRGPGPTVRVVELPDATRRAMLAETVLSSKAPDLVQTPVGAAHFESSGAITVPRGSSTMLSMVNAQTKGEVVYLYDPESPRGNADFAFQAVRFVNPTDSVLDSGPVTVLADGRFVGEGLCEPIPARSPAFVPFALDRQLRIERKAEPGEHVARIVAAQRGVLSAEVQRTATTKLVVHSSAPEPTVLYVRRTVPQGYSLSKAPPDRERVGDAYLFRVAVPAQGQVEVEIEESTPIERTLDLRTAADRASLAAYLGQAPADQPLRAQLAEAMKLASAAGELEQRLASARDQAGEQRRRLDEVHAQVVSLKAVKSAAPLVATLERSLGELNDMVAKSTTTVVTLQQDLLVARVRFEQAIEALTLERKPTR